MKVQSKQEKVFKYENLVNQTNTSCSETEKQKVLLQHELFVFFICFINYRVI